MDIEKIINRRRQELQRKRQGGSFALPPVRPNALAAAQRKERGAQHCRKVSQRATSSSISLSRQPTRPKLPPLAPSASSEQFSLYDPIKGRYLPPPPPQYAEVIERARAFEQQQAKEGPSNQRWFDYNG